MSSEELDYLHDMIKVCGVTDSLIMGGFGGFTINLLKKDLLDSFIKTAKKKFSKKYGHEPKVYNVGIRDEAHNEVKVWTAIKQS